MDLFRFPPGAVQVEKDGGVHLVVSAVPRLRSQPFMLAALRILKQVLPTL